MSKILKYELKRQIFNKFFIGLLAINGLYAWYTLTSDIIAGTAYTAPFSGWSFGTYLSTVMPIISLTILFMMSRYFSKKEKQVQVITSATPVDPIRFMLTRCTAITVGFILIITVLLIISAYFYISFFKYYNFTAFLLPIIYTLIPSYVFILGLGILAGRVHQGLFYVLMLVSLALCFVHISGAFDFFGRGYYNNYPITLPVSAGGEPAFSVSDKFLLARLAYLLLGLGMLTVSIQSVKRKARRDSLRI
ncbi:MAG: hypothetical protein Q8920_02105 [Bacillota bacterium]|nr:hypothetical protein [Bacillota bacterium]